MPNSAVAELYLIAILIFLILAFSATAFFLFIRQYKREMREKDAAKKQKAEAAKEQ